MFGTSVVTGPWEVLVVKCPPLGDQTSSQRTCCFVPHGHVTVGKPVSWLEADMHTEACSPELPAGGADWLIFSTSLIFGLLISHMLVFTSLPNPLPTPSPTRCSSDSHNGPEFRLLSDGGKISSSHQEAHSVLRLLCFSFLFCTPTEH